ncbi:hypothetical protein C8035_v004628 [Colletotrichum spinosum]|uniref:Uncharacterized protein n=1 Tax=Colletotrichum spinosum TaxID=1347390 RepID=A0A4V3HQU8_9PEZI|nr:hypothetical protein C8035_v004628 [Colletotrichum spinosum]
MNKAFTLLRRGITVRPSNNARFFFHTAPTRCARAEEFKSTSYTAPQTLLVSEIDSELSRIEGLARSLTSVAARLERDIGASAININSAMGTAPAKMTSDVSGAGLFRPVWKGVVPAETGDVKMRLNAVDGDMDAVIQVLERMREDLKERGSTQS